MKKFAKIVTVVMAIVMAFSTFTVFAGANCNGGDDNIEQHTVTFINPYAPEANRVHTTVQVNTNTAVAAPATTPEREDHLFSHWTLVPATAYTTSAPFNFATQIERDTTLYAQFIYDGARISFVMGRGGAPVVPMFAMNRGDVLAATDPRVPAVPVRPQFNFLGWYQVINNQYAATPFVFGRAMYDDTIIAARWEVIPHTPTGALRMDSFNFDMVFHPFFATSAADGAVAGQTQVSMISVDAQGLPTAGDNLPTVARDFRHRVFVRGIEDPYPHNAFRQLSHTERRNPAIVQTHYEFLIKNGIRFSDGTPLTIQDVLFNMYVYLDPVYTGSNTMNSTAILGLEAWRTQQPGITTREQYLAWRRTFEQAAFARRQDINQFWNHGPVARRTFRQNDAPAHSERERRIISDAHEIRRGFWSDLVGFWNQAAATNFHPVQGTFADPQWTVPTGMYRGGEHMGFTEPWQVFLNWFGMIQIARGADGQINWIENPTHPTDRPDGPFSFSVTPNLLGSMPTLENSGQYIHRYDMVNGVPVPVFLARDAYGDPVAPALDTRGQFPATRIFSNIYDDDGAVVGQYLSSVTTSAANGNVDLAIPVIRSGLYTITQIYNNWLGLLTPEEIGRTARLSATGAPILAAPQPNINGCVYSPATDWIIDPATLEIVEEDAANPNNHNGNHFRLYALDTTPSTDVVTAASRGDRSRNGFLMARMIHDTNMAATADHLIDIPTGMSFGTVRSNIFSIAVGWGAGNRLLQNWVAEAISDNLEAQQGSALNRPVSEIEGITVTETRSFNGSVYGFRDFGAYHHVLNVRIGGVDPAGIWRLAPTVAPVHYYSNPTVAGRSSFHDPMDGYRGFNMPGVSFDRVYVPGRADRPWISNYNPNMRRSPGFIPGNRQFFSQVFQATDVQRLPMGAGAFMATNRDSQRNNSNTATTVTHSQFFENQVVRFIYNPHFYTTGEFMHNPFVRYLQYHVMPSHQVISALSAGTINFGAPSATYTNLGVINATAGVYAELTPNRGYGYVGVNASRVRCLAARQAIMYAMNPQLTVNYFGGDLAELINRPMSNTSWAYNHNALPRYRLWPSESAVVARIRDLLTGAGFTRGSDGILTRTCANVGQIRLAFTFTVAGGEQDHPAWDMFIQAARILNTINIGGGNFDIQVTTDPAALAAISAGTLDVWAAAWGAGVDPDMFQLYHRDSTAVNVNAWGFPWLIGQNNATAEEWAIINAMADAIDASRSTFDRQDRIVAFHQALDLLMDLAIELPTYQRQNLPAFNNQIDRSTLNPTPGAFHGLIHQIWTVRVVN